MTKSQQLEKKLGGKWTYNRKIEQWFCDDGRYVSRVHTGGIDVNGEAAPGWDYFVYENNRGTRIYLK